MLFFSPGGTLMSVDGNGNGVTFIVYGNGLSFMVYRLWFIVIVPVSVFNVEGV